MTSIEYIEEFVTLSKIGSYSEAASELYISQSTLTRHIQSLEEQLGVQLFNRTTRAISLSDSGKAFLPYAQEIVRIKKEYTDALDIKQRNNPMTLFLGYTAYISELNLLYMISAFQKEHPEYALNMIEGLSHEIVDMLQKGVFTFAFTWKPKSLPEKFNVIPCLEDHMVLVVPATMRIGDEISLEKLQSLELAGQKVLLPKDPIVNSIIQSRVSRSHIILTNITGYRDSTLIDLVNQRMGIAIMNKRSAKTMVTTSLRIVEIVPRINITFGLIYNKDNIRSPSDTAFLRYMTSAIADYQEKQQRFQI